MVEGAPAGRQRPQVVLLLKLLVAYYRYVNLIAYVYLLAAHDGKTIDDARKHIIQLAACKATRKHFTRSLWAGNEVGEGCEFSLGGERRPAFEVETPHLPPISADGCLAKGSAPGQPG